MARLTTLADKAGAALTPGEADANMLLLDVRTGDGWADIVSELIIRDTPLAPIGILYKGGI
jgi:hypothetical protein